MLSNKHTTQHAIRVHARTHETQLPSTKTKKQKKMNSMPWCMDRAREEGTAAAINGKWQRMRVECTAGNQRFASK